MTIIMKTTTFTILSNSKIDQVMDTTIHDSLWILISHHCAIYQHHGDYRQTCNQKTRHNLATSRYQRKQRNGVENCLARVTYLPKAFWRFMNLVVDGSLVVQDYQSVACMRKVYQMMAAIRSIVVKLFLQTTIRRRQKTVSMNAY